MMDALVYDTLVDMLEARLEETVEYVIVDNMKDICNYVDISITKVNVGFLY